jgi:hypothetical protein
LPIISNLSQGAQLSVITRCCALLKDWLFLLKKCLQNDVLSSKLMKTKRSVCFAGEAA